MVAEITAKNCRGGYFFAAPSTLVAKNVNMLYGIEIQCNFFTHSYGNSVCPSVCLSVLVSRPGTIPSPGETETSSLPRVSGIS